MCYVAENRSKGDVEGSGTGTVVADAVSPVIRLGTGLPEVAQALGWPSPSLVGWGPPAPRDCCCPSLQGDPRTTSRGCRVM